MLANLEIEIEDDPNDVYALPHNARLKCAAAAATVLTLRRFIAGIMIIIALGRFNLYPSYIQSSLLTREQYGFMLLILGLLLWPMPRWNVDQAWTLGRLRIRKDVPGRVVAGLSAVLMAGMAWDVGTISVTSALEFWMSLALLREVFVNDA